MGDDGTNEVAIGDEDVEFEGAADVTPERGMGTVDGTVDEFEHDVVADEEPVVSQGSGDIIGDADGGEITSDGVPVRSNLDDIAVRVAAIREHIAELFRDIFDVEEDVAVFEDDEAELVSGVNVCGVDIDGGNDESVLHKQALSNRREPHQ